MNDKKNNAVNERSILTGHRIKELRLEKRLSQKQLADMVGYKNNSAIAQIEADCISVPYDRLLKFADALDTNIDFLTGSSNDKKRAPFDATGGSFLQNYHDKDLGALESIINKLYKATDSHPKMLETFEMLADYSCNLTDSDLRKIQDFIRLRGESNRSANDKYDI